jgi:hypothetical protein
MKKIFVLIAFYSGFSINGMDKPDPQKKDEELSSQKTDIREYHELGLNICTATTCFDIAFPCDGTISGLIEFLKMPETTQVVLNNRVLDCNSTISECGVTVRDTLFLVPGFISLFVYFEKCVWGYFKFPEDFTVSTVLGYFFPYSHDMLHNMLFVCANGAFEYGQSCTLCSLDIPNNAAVSISSKCNFHESQFYDFEKWGMAAMFEHFCNDIKVKQGNSGRSLEAQNGITDHIPTNPIPTKIPEKSNEPSTNPLPMPSEWYQETT